MNKYENNIVQGISDNDFVRDKIPMTKEEVRVVTISKLELNSKDVLIDIGAGTGSITIECARLLEGQTVYAVEQKALGVKLIKENATLFKCKNIEVINNKAPEGLAHIKSITKAVIGGSGGQIENIISWVFDHMTDNGIVVMNTITIENAYKSIKYLKQYGFIDIEVTQMAISKGKSVGDLTMMMANNPVTIIKARKGVCYE